MRIQSDSWPTNQPSPAQPSPVWAHWPASNKFRLRPVTKIQLSLKLLSVYKIFKPLLLVCWWKFSVPKVNLPSWREKRGMKSCIDEYYYLLFQEALKRNLIFDIHKTAPLLRPQDRRVQSRWTLDSLDARMKTLLSPCQFSGELSWTARSGGSPWPSWGPPGARTRGWWCLHPSRASPSPCLSPCHPPLVGMGGDSARGHCCCNGISHQWVNDRK